ncbi:hypothetical protein ASG89_06655 [Paenibacillus sp. Soil766]|uniref:hypothetical protein n=1 Tax=Paenibacillus sp. Soil766 TaxID=1736404 RepID=UPI00070FBC43|nr:hypothetical protein [Paenibacillus sp. Soil766]KRE93180.1 hypothetical protein ASG89_06655 [Paenibacillus sp. Soil766]
MKLLIPLRSERGNVLTYVLLILLVLMIVTPVILANSSTNQLANSQTEYEKKATDLAVSGMEAFITYLKNYDIYGNGMNRRTYFNKYGGGSGAKGLGWETQTITTPEGVETNYEQYVEVASTNTRIGIPISTDDVYNVYFKATVNNVHSKLIKFQISAFNAIVVPTPSPSPSASPTPSPTPNSSTHIESGQTVPIPAGVGVLYGDSSNVTAGKNTTLLPAITNYMSDIKSSVSSAIDDYLNVTKTPGLITCSTSCSISQVQSNINASTTNPVVIYVPGTLSISSNETLGSSTKPVILIADNYSFNNANIVIYGNLIANKTTANSTTTGNITGSNQLDITINNGNGGTHGNFWIEGNFVTGTQTTLKIANNIYAGGLTLSNGGTVSAKQMTIDTTFRIETQTTLNISNGNLSSGNIYVKNNAELTVSSGDIFVSGDFTSGTQINLKTGGLIAVAGEIDFKNNSTIRTGTSDPPVTSLQLSGTSSATPTPSASSSATPTPTATSTITPTPPPDWNPVRK